MLRTIRNGLWAAVCLGLAASAAEAAPVSPVTAGLSVDIIGLGPPLSATGIGAIDVTGSTITVPAGLVSLGSSLTIPLTGVSALNSLVVTKLSNLSATFSIGGATGQVAGETCPPGTGQACVDGGGLGGVMALTGVVFIHVVPNIVVIPVNLNQALIGQGGSATAPFSFDGAPWTTGVARVNTGSTLATTGTNTGNSVSLVTGTFVAACGNLLPIFSRFSLTGVPEAGTLLLFAFGAGGAFWLLARR